MKIVCVIPTFNCEREITQTLNRALEVFEFFSEIWVIDNGSTDKTLDNVLSFREKYSVKNFKVYKNLININLGGTHKVAFRMAVENQFTHLVLLHGDNQANPADLISVLKEISHKCAYGSYFGARFSRQSTLTNYSYRRVLGNLALNSIYSIFTRRLLIDLGSGLNVYDLNQIAKCKIDSITDSMSFNYGLILEFIENDLDFTYFPISWTEDSQVSNAKNFRIFKEGLIALMKWRFKLRSGIQIVNHNSPREIV